MAAEADTVELAESEQDEEEDVYEVERIIDIRVEEGEVLYRVRWKNYCSDDDTWEPEAHLEDCREVLLAFKKAHVDAKAKKEAEAKKSVKVLPTKSDLFDADSDSNSDKDRPSDLPVKKKKKKKKHVEEPLPKDKKKKKKDKRWEDIRPLPAPETDEEQETAPTPPSSPREKKTDPKKRVVDSDDDDDEPLPTKRHKKDKGKEAGKQKQKAEEGKKKNRKKELKIDASDDDTAPIEDDISESPSEPQTDDNTTTEAMPKTTEKVYLDEKFKDKRGKWEVKLQGFKDLIQKKENKKPDASPKESSFQKLKNITSKAKEDLTPHSSDSSDSSTLQKKSKSKENSVTAPPKAQMSSLSAIGNKGKEEKVKEDVPVQRDTAGSTNLFEKFLLNCEAKDRAPRRPAVHQPPLEKSGTKPTKLTGKIEKIPKPSKDSPTQKTDSERTEKVKQAEAPSISKSGQSYGFSLDSDEREGEEFVSKTKPVDEVRKDRPDETQRSSWERRSSTDSKTRRREDSEPRLFMACDDNQDSQDPLEATDKAEKSQATLSLGMDLNLDWMTLDDFQKHLNGEDERLSGPPLSSSELRDAVKSGDYMAVKLALNSKEDYNLDQEASAVGMKRCMIEERPPCDIYSSSLNFVDTKNKESVANAPARFSTAEMAVGRNTNTSCEPATKLRWLRRNENENNAIEKVNNLSEEEAARHPDRTETCSSNVAKRRCHRHSNVKTEIPTRTGLRTCKKESKPIPNTEEEEKKGSGKKHLCLYCKMAFPQLSKHLEMKHTEETDVANAIHFLKGSKIRQTLLDQIRNKGDYEHNCKVQKSGEGEIVTKKQIKNTTVSVRDFLPCQYCFAFYRKTELWRHEWSCKAKKYNQKPERAKKGKVYSAASQLLPVSEFLTGGCEEIIHIMHQDSISRHIRNDPLICKYGNALSVKYDHDKSQFAYIAQKMRELGRFVLAVCELDSSVQYLHEICLPSRFELAVEGAKKASGFDPSSSTFKTISLVSKIGYSLKRAAEIAFGESRMIEDGESETEIQNFIDLLDTKWNVCFSRKALASTQNQEMKNVEVDKSAVTEDLLKLRMFITGEEEEAKKEFRASSSMTTWKKMSEAVLADVCLFNRRRVGNIGRLLLKTYTTKTVTGKCVTSTDQMRKSTKLELDLGDRFTRVELEGQYGRSMLVLLTERVVSLIDLLTEYREKVGISKNVYLFACTEGPSFIRGLDCLRKASVECGVVNPEALLCPSLREQIASKWQLLSLCESEPSQVARLLGKSSQECYELSKNATLLEEASRQLLKMDQMLPSCICGSAKEGALSKPAVKRRPWSEKEQAAVKRFLSEFITKRKVPGKKECNACLASEPDLCRRSWTDVKNFVHNTLQTLRRQNQPKPERNSVNPKGQTAGPQNTKHFKVKNNIVCNLTINPDDLQDTISMPTTTPSNVMEQSTYFPHEMTSGYLSFSSPNSSTLCTSSTSSSFASQNALDMQVVPTYTPLRNTNPVMHRMYSSETRFLPPMSPSYTHNTSKAPLPSMFLPQDTSSPMLPFTSRSFPSTSMLPTYTSLNTDMFPLYPTDRNGTIISSFTPLHHSSNYYSIPTKVSTSAQVVLTIHAPTMPGRSAVAEESMSPISEQADVVEKTQKRNKRLWSEEEQAAVRRQLGDFCELVKVPGKRDCDACLAAEPALSTRTWKEVKYFVHNSIQSMKRKGIVIAPKQGEMMESKTQTTNSEWDAPVYLSL